MIFSNANIFDIFKISTFLLFIFLIFLIHAYLTQTVQVPKLLWCKNIDENFNPNVTNDRHRRT